MHKTKHIERRMGQRGISKAMIELVLNYGKDAGDKVILDRRSAQKQREDFRTLMKIVYKGGVTVVVQGEALITAYNFEVRNH